MVLLFSRLPVELLEKILLFLEHKNFEKIQDVSPEIKSIFTSTFFWKRRCMLDYNYKRPELKDKISSWYKMYVALETTLCKYCFVKTTRINSFYDDRICRDCEELRPGKYALVCKSTAIKQFKLHEDDLQLLQCKYVKNPHYSSMSPMQLYLKCKVIEASVIRAILSTSR